MKHLTRLPQGFLSLFASASLLCGVTAAQDHASVSSVAVNPANPNEVWVCNRGNDSVSVIDVSTGTTTHEIDVGVWPRSLAFHPDGTKVYVANQRGNVPVDVNFVTPFTGTEVRGSLSVIDVASKSVAATLTGVGTEPYGVQFAPNDMFYVVSGFRSGTIKIFNAADDALLLDFQYPHQMNVITSGTVLDVDSNVDLLPDLAEPRAFAIRSSSRKIYVTHLTSGFVSVLDLAVPGSGIPTAIVLTERIDLNEYAPHPTQNPVPVQTVASQGTPRFLDDIVLAPNGDTALVPHVLHNVNHDVNHDFAGAIDGDFANRVYPALTSIDALTLSYGQPGDNSARIHHEWTDPANPAAYVPYGEQAQVVKGGIPTLGGLGAPKLGGVLQLKVSGADPADIVLAFYGPPVGFPFPVPGLGFLHNLGTYGVFPMVGGEFTAPINNNPAWEGLSLHFQAVVTDGVSGEPLALTNGLEVYLSADSAAPGTMGHRAGQPSRVAYGPSGTRVLMLNRGSEDVFLYNVIGAPPTLQTVFPPRHNHVERAALDTSTPMGDLPLGWLIVEDTTTTNNDSLIYIVNESTSTLSSLRVDWDTFVITEEQGQISTLLGADQLTVSERIGQELFEDASRAQTAGNFNNSCASCHFEGGADGNVWQRPAGPRTTMPVYGGSLLTGLILWKGVRLNMGETGPMFGGENGGHGIFTDAEQQGLIDYHEVIPVPLNPNLDPITGEYSATAELGRDLFFGLNDTGLNPTQRHAGCFNCHPDHDAISLEVRGYTSDFVDTALSSLPGQLEALDPLCFSLQENIVAQNIRNVNSGVNVDGDDPDSLPDNDRNLDGFSDLESYVPMNPDSSDDFTRDDPNDYDCPQDGIPGNPQKLFFRAPELFSVPTKLGVFSTGPYFHDHSAVSLRALLDPSVQQSDPIYGNAAYPYIGKMFNEFHDVRGHEDFLPGASKVQVTLQTLASGSTFDADIEALLEYIRAL